MLGEWWERDEFFLMERPLSQGSDGLEALGMLNIEGDAAGKEKEKGSAFGRGRRLDESGAREGMRRPRDFAPTGRGLCLYTNLTRACGRRNDLKGCVFTR